MRRPSIVRSVTVTLWARILNIVDHATDAHQVLTIIANGLIIALVKGIIACSSPSLYFVFCRIYFTLSSLG